MVAWQRHSVHCRHQVVGVGVGTQAAGLGTQAAGLARAGAAQLRLDCLGRLRRLENDSVRRSQSMSVPPECSEMYVVGHVRPDQHFAA